MSKLANAVLIGFISFLFLLAIFWYAVDVGDSKQVSVVSLTTSWGPVDADETVIEGMVTFRNPHAFQVELVRLSYEFTINGERLSGGVEAKGQTVGAGSDIDVPFALRFPSSFVPEWWASHNLNGEASNLVIEGEAVFLVSSDSTPVDFRSQAGWDEEWLESWSEALPNCPTEPPSPCVEETSYGWRRGSTGVVLEAFLRILNPSNGSMEITDGTLAMGLADIDVAQGELAQPVTIPAGQTREIRFEAVFESQSLRQWWPHHVASCETSRANLDVQIAYEVTSVSFGGNNSTSQTVEEAVSWSARLPNLETRILCDP